MKEKLAVLILLAIAAFVLLGVALPSIQIALANVETAVQLIP